MRDSRERECGYITAPTDPNQPELDPKVWRAVSGQPCGFPSTMPPRHSQGRRRKSPPRGARVLAERRPGLLGSACVVGDGKRIPACRSLPPTRKFFWATETVVIVTQNPAPSEARAIQPPPGTRERPEASSRSKGVRAARRGYARG